MLGKRIGFQSTPPVKAATVDMGKVLIACEISIHAAREGGDLTFVRMAKRGRKFQSTPPVKAATANVFVWYVACLFQSTPPVKAATHLSCTIIHLFGFQSTPPVKAATHECKNCKRLETISIHAAREGGDGNMKIINASYRIISIHAAREGGDNVILPLPHSEGYFNPRRP